MSEEIEFLEENSVLPPESESDNEPMPVYKVWFLAFFKPSEERYIQIANQPDISAKTAFLWIAIVVFFTSFRPADVIMVRLGAMRSSVFSFVEALIAVVFFYYYCYFDKKSGVFFSENTFL